MNRIVLLVLTAMIASVGVNAQIDGSVADDLAVKPLAVDSIPWKYKGIIGAGFNAVQLSNWTGGGQDAVTFRALFIGILDYSHERFSWENDLDLGYSLTKQGDQDFRKADDKIIYTTKASMKQNDWLRYTGFVDFRTQFYIGYNYDQTDNTSPSGFLKVSDFMAPAFLTASLGAEWTPVEEFRFMVAPIASRSTFVMDDALAATGAFGVTPGSNSVTDIGAVFNASLMWEFVENVTWKSRLNSFMRYQSPELWVVTLENAFLMKVNSFLSVGILTDIFYDDKVPVVRDDGTVGPATQLRNQLVIDFTYSLSNF